MTATLSAAEEAELRASVYGIVAKFGNDYFTRCSETLQPPTELWDALAAGGFVGVNLPEEYGGGGMGLSAISVVAEEAAAAGCPQIMLMISPGIVGSLLARHATPEQKQRWLAPMAAGSCKIAFAITEPDAGSNSHHITTTAHRDGDKYYISGQKPSSPAPTKRTPYWLSPGPAPTRPDARSCHCFWSTAMHPASRCTAFQ